MMDLPVTEAQPAPQETDYSQLIVQDATPVTAPREEPQADAETVADSEPEPVAEVTQEAEAETPTPTEPKADGTPDKWRQKVDQRLAEIDKLVARKQDGTITPKEETRLEQKKDELREILERGELADPVTAKRLLDVEKKSSDETESIRKEVEQLKEQLRETQRQSIWRSEREKYPGVDVENTVWPNAAKDATEQVRKEIELSGMADDFDEKTIEKMCYARTRTLYEQRAADALKSVKARNGKPETSSSKTASLPGSKPTPSGAKVMVQGSSGGVPKPSDPNNITDQDYRNLLIQE